MPTPARVDPTADSNCLAASGGSVLATSSPSLTIAVRALASVPSSWAYPWSRVVARNNVPIAMSSSWNGTETTRNNVPLMRDDAVPPMALRADGNRDLAVARPAVREAARRRQRAMPDVGEDDGVRFDSRRHRLELPANRGQPLLPFGVGAREGLGVEGVDRRFQI